MFQRDNFGLVIFKLLNDLLLILVCFFAFFVIADGILPGIISNFFKPYYAALLLLVNILLLSALGRKIGASISVKSNKKTAFALVFLSLLLLFINLLRINIWLNIFIVLTSLLTGCFVYRVLKEENID
jgi:hypothetical protein